MRSGTCLPGPSPPNSQGYLGPATLAVFEMLGPPSDPADPDWWHLLIEAFRSMAWERDDLVADPDHAPLPGHLLLDPARLGRAADTVDRAATGVWPRRMGSESSTAYMCIVDDEGLAVSIIQSNFEGTGSAFGAGTSGFLLHNRGSGFSLTPGHPNELQPVSARCTPLSPTLWTRDREPKWVIGTRGGSVQPQLVAQVAARAILAGKTIEEAQTAPRWVVREFGPFSKAASPGGARYRRGHALRPAMRRGHLIEELPDRQPGWGPVSIDQNRRQGPHDLPGPPRRHHHAIVFS